MNDDIIQFFRINTDNWVSAEQISEHVELGVNSVYKQLKNLEKRNELQIIKVKQSHTAPKTLYKYREFDFELEDIKQQILQTKKEDTTLQEQILLNILRELKKSGEVLQNVEQKLNQI